MSIITELVKILKDLYVDPELDMLCGVDGECRQAIKESAKVIEELSAKLQDEQNLRMKQESVLDKIRAEIELNAYPIVHGVNNHEKGMTLYGILQIIDKYKAESEEE